MSYSISHRIYRGFLISGIIYTVSIYILVYLLDYDIERTMLSAGMAQQQAFYARKIDGSFHTWETADTVATFIPATTAADPQQLPQVFHGLTPPFQDEFEYPDGRTVLVSVKQMPNGAFYIARDISLLEQRELAHLPAFAAFGVFIILLVFVLSRQISKRLSEPLVRLVENIRHLEPGSQGHRLPEDFKDQELKAIATTMNKFLDSLEEHIKREKSLISMTSHELRTPVTVISGAVEILEKRNRLTEDDRKTLGRIRQTCNDMRSNTEALLLLARHTDTHVKQNNQTVITTVNHVKNELAHAREDAGLRIKLTNTGKAAMYMADSALSHMLFRNLLDNALRHTGGKIRVGFTEDSVFIEDEGHGFAAINPDRDQPVQAETHATAEYGGLGLSIVTMIAEKLGWKVHIDSPSGAGNRIVIVFKP